MTKTFNLRIWHADYTADGDPVPHGYRAATGDLVSTLRIGQLVIGWEITE